MGESKPSNYPRGKAESKPPPTSMQSPKPQSSNCRAYYKHMHIRPNMNNTGLIAWHWKQMTWQDTIAWNDIKSSKHPKSNNKNEHCCRVHGSAHQCKWQTISQKHNENDTKLIRQSSDTTDRMTNQTRTNKAVHTAKVASSEPKKQLVTDGRTDGRTHPPIEPLHRN